MPNEATAGYSTRSLVEKLGIKAGQRIAILNAPAQYIVTLGPLPEGVVVQDALTPGLLFIQAFVTQRHPLEAIFPALRQALSHQGMVWISWPKRTVKPPHAKIATDLDENIIREIGLANGLVDVKVAAIDVVWSGLKFVYRLKDR